MNYKLLGTLDTVFLENIKQDVLARNTLKGFQNLFLSDKLATEFQQRLFPANFETDDLKIHHSKVFLTRPNVCYPIHKDGIDKKCALNVIISCNENDWVRWYTDDAIKAHNGTEHLILGKSNTRDVDIKDVDHVPFIEEVHNNPGDVYLVNTDVYHSFKNNGNKDRIVIQTKFSINPTVEELYNRIQQVGLNL